MSETKTQFTLASSNAAYVNMKKTKEMITEENAWRDQQDVNGHPQRGISGHIMFGHGANQDTFEKRDFATTNDLMYEKRQKVEEIINPHSFENDFGKSRSKQMINTKPSDIPQMFGKSAGQIKPKSYGEFTKRFDNNSNNTGLRQ